MASILDSPHIHKRRWRGVDAAHTRGERETMMMMMHMAKISPLGRATGRDGVGDGGGDRTTASGTSHNRVD